MLPEIDLNDLSCKKRLAFVLKCADLVGAYKHAYLLPFLEAIQDSLYGIERVLLKDQLPYTPIGNLVYFACTTAHTHDITQVLNWVVSIDASLLTILLPYTSALENLQFPKTPFVDVLEQLVYLNDCLDYPIFETYENKFRLNFWDRKYKYQVIGSIEEISKYNQLGNLIYACTI